MSARVLKSPPANRALKRLGGGWCVKCGVGADEEKLDRDSLCLGCIADIAIELANRSIKRAQEAISSQCPPVPSGNGRR